MNYPEERTCYVPIDAKQVNLEWVDENGQTTGRCEVPIFRGIPTHHQCESHNIKIVPTDEISWNREREEIERLQRLAHPVSEDGEPLPPLISERTLLETALGPINEYDYFDETIEFTPELYDKLMQRVLKRFQALEPKREE